MRTLNRIQNATTLAEYVLLFQTNPVVTSAPVSPRRALKRKKNAAMKNTHSSHALTFSINTRVLTSIKEV
jgi:hypothetical protein